MAGYILGLYPAFSCLAERCPATCCSGWKIEIDKASYERFSNLEDEKLRLDIMGHIIGENGHYRFRNRNNGDCAMLDADGLCRIQRNTDEQTLCNTCRKYPRLTDRNEDGHIISLAASCPVVADYILDGQVSWFSLSENGRLQPMPEAELMKEIGFSAAMEQIFLNVESLSASEHFEHYVDIAMDALDVLLQHQEFPYLENSFELYEQEKPDEIRFQRYFKCYGSKWKQFVHQYLLYRCPGRHMEYPAENPQECIVQAQGELLLMRVILCSRYTIQGNLQQKDWETVIHWVYRFCAHGELAAKQNHQNFMKNQELLPSLIFEPGG